MHEATVARPVRRMVMPLLPACLTPDGQLRASPVPAASESRYELLPAPSYRPTRSSAAHRSYAACDVVDLPGILVMLLEAPIVAEPLK